MTNKGLLKSLDAPLAIAMWDFSWMLSEDFGDIGKALDGLVERGYNAVRIDVFPPALYSHVTRGINLFTYPGHNDVEVLWGNRTERNVNTPEKIVEIFTECIKRGIYIGVSSWFIPALEDKADIQREEFLEMWDCTIKFLEDRGLMKGIIYIDLSNEYPCNSGMHNYTFEDIVRDVRREAVEAGRDPGAAAAAVWVELSDYWLTHFKSKWKDYDFTLSEDGMRYKFAFALDKMDVFDFHLWYNNYPGFIQTVTADIHSSDEAYLEAQEQINRMYAENGAEYDSWMEETIADYAAAADRYGVPIGNTEGWGTIGWHNCEITEWDFIKLAAEKCIRWCRRYDCYKFICTSNFTHPYFKKLWDDVEWHKKMNKLIREK